MHSKIDAVTLSADGLRYPWDSHPGIDQVLEVAPGILWVRLDLPFRLNHVNIYLIADGDGYAMVDTGIGNEATIAAWTALFDGALKGKNITRVIVTHAHPDHLGFARMASDIWNVPIWAHPDERPLARHPYRYAHERSRLISPIAHPASIPVLATLIEAGALRVRPVTTLHLFSPGETLDVPGRPTVLHTPGHTAGHCALYFAGRDTVISGDALVTFDPHTGKEGPQIISGAATANTGRALLSLGILASTDAGIMLPGHGHAWRDGIGHAAALARQASGL